jgi:hypothetical protein
VKEREEMDSVEKGDLEWGVKRVDGEPLALYGARTIFSQNWYDEVSLDYVPGRTDFRQASVKHGDLLKRDFPVLNKLACHFILKKIYDGLPEYFYEPVLLIDVGLYRVHIQRARNYMNITFSVYDKTMDLSEMEGLINCMIDDKRLVYLKDEIYNEIDRLSTSEEEGRLSYYHYKHCLNKANERVTKNLGL